ncbi:hypothetical protein [Dictyobacter formicarum]|uniref:Uncharacterized protein n=1 Tax=Dictyobacter formicarum TaxID=2778368 RepID=A0ABQ3VFP3_9CHLR|nr:hypothetical protein [Dictyobacter formicarum]GHO84198.1 hypothetical protein KSZ_22040 [Dictyobacter formicarum]
MLNNRVLSHVLLRERAAIFDHDTHAVLGAATGVYASGLAVFVRLIGVAQGTSVPISRRRPPDII